jgi:hydrogenase maturation protease
VTIRVIGLGSDLGGDDGAGLAVARRLREEGGHNLDIRMCSGDTASLLGMWEGSEVVLVIDAADTGSPPGTVHHFELEESLPPLTATRSIGSTHKAGLADAISLAEALGRLPARLIVYLIEGACFDVGAPLSPTVAAAVPTVCARIKRFDRLRSTGSR